MSTAEPDNHAAAQPSRRCWRCLQNFDCPADEVSAGPTEWWLCDPCQATLIGTR